MKRVNQKSVIRWSRQWPHWSATWLGGWLKRAAVDQPKAGGGTGAGVAEGVSPGRRVAWKESNGGDFGIPRKRFHFVELSIHPCWLMNYRTSGRVLFLRWNSWNWPPFITQIKRSVRLFPVFLLPRTRMNDDHYSWKKSLLWITCSKNIEQFLFYCRWWVLNFGTNFNEIFCSSLNAPKAGISKNIRRNAQP